MLCISMKFHEVLLFCNAQCTKKDKNSTYKSWKKNRLRSLPCIHCQVCTSILIRIKPPNLSVNILTKIHFQNSTKLNLKILIKIQLQNLCQTLGNTPTAILSVRSETTWWGRCLCQQHLQRDHHQQQHDKANWISTPIRYQFTSVKFS